MNSVALLMILASAPAYDISSWDLFPNSIPRSNASGDTPAGYPVISAGGIVSDPAQVTGEVTNLVLQSEAIVSGAAPNSPWTRNNSGVGAVACSTVSGIAPDGRTVSLSRLQIPAITSGQFSQVYQSISGSAAGTYQWSMWLKVGSGSTCPCRIRMYDSSSKGTTDVTVTDQWQRFSGSATLGGAGSLLIGNSEATLSASDVLVFGAQVEVVGNLSMPGPYVATTTTSSSGVRGEYSGQPSDPGILVPVKLSDPRTWGVGISASKASWAGADALVDLGGQLSGYRWNSARLETTAAGALVMTVIDATGASATRTVAAHEFADGSTHRLSFGAFDGIPFLLVDGVDSGTLAGAAVLSSFPSAIGINSTVHPAAKTVYRVSQGPTPWSAQTRLK